jgi:class 3 adenylate cyclase
MEAELPSGTVRFLLTKGRRMMRLSSELPPDLFDALLSEYQRLLRRLFEEMGGRDVEVSGDSALAAFPAAKQAALAAVAAQSAVAAHEWPQGLRPAISVGLHTEQAGIGSIGAAAARCSELCEDLGELSIRDLGRAADETDSARPCGLTSSSSLGSRKRDRSMSRETAKLL